MVLVASLAAYVFQKTPALKRAAQFDAAQDRSTSDDRRSKQGPMKGPTAEQQLNQTLTAPVSGDPTWAAAPPPGPTMSQAPALPPGADPDASLRSSGTARILAREAVTASSDGAAAGRSDGQSSSAPSPASSALGDPTAGKKAAEVPLTASRSSALPAPSLAAPSAQVVGRLTVKDRQAANRQLTDLLSRVGGAETARHIETTDDAVDVLIPRASYPAFAEGLARIGSWLPLTEPSELPDHVLVTLSITQ